MSFLENLTPQDQEFQNQSMSEQSESQVVSEPAVSRDIPDVPVDPVSVAPSDMVLPRRARRKKPPESAKKSGIREVYEWMDSLVVAIVAVVLLFTFVFRVVGVDGTSMLQTLQDSDRVVISHWFYTPSYGDIVVISRNYQNDESLEMTKQTEPIIKRVIATEGQEVDIDFEAGTVKVDGQLLVEDYVNTPTNVSYDISFPVTVPPGCVFVMGDNRNGSLDSRSSSIGMIDTRYILGRAYVRIWRIPESRFFKYDIFEWLA